MATATKQDIFTLGLVLLVGFTIRLLIFIQPYTINPDGVLYIQQAQAIAHHDFKELTTCGLSFVSTYTIFIAIVHFLLGDWLFSARIISFVFGTLTLAPIFFTARLFFNRKIAAIVGLVYAMIPVMVSRSIDVVRDPTSWFFFAMGVYSVAAATKKEHPAKTMIAGSIFFILATLTRIETGILMVTTCLFLCVAPITRRRSMILSFLLPPFVITIIGVVVVFIYKVNILLYIRGNDFINRIDGPLQTYKKLRISLQKQMSASSNNFITQNFFKEASRGIWFLGFGVLLNRFMEAFYYPYAFIALAGLRNIRQILKGDPRVHYFMFLCAASLVLLYHAALTNWMIEYRYMVILLISCVILIGSGLDSLTTFLTERFLLKRKIVVIGISFLIIIASIPKNFSIQPHGNTIFKEAGELILANSGPSPKLTLSFTSLVSQPLVSYYANHTKENSFHKVNWRTVGYKKNFKPKITTDKALANYLRKKSVQYFLWEENYLPRSIKQLRNSIFSSTQFHELGRWHHKEGGEMCLFKVNPLP